MQDLETSTQYLQASLLMSVLSISTHVLVVIRLWAKMQRSQKFALLLCSTVVKLRQEVEAVPSYPH